MAPITEKFSKRLKIESVLRSHSVVGFRLLLLLMVIGLVACANGRPTAPTPIQTAAVETSFGWTPAELETLRSLALTSLPPLPPDPSNRVADDPIAATLGHRLFFDRRLSADGQINCATCHQPDRYFSDGLPRAEALGRTARNTPTIVGAAYSPWFYWDGRRDSQWAQALTPLEATVEHGGTRTQFVHLIAADDTYRAAYEALFGPLPDFSDPVRFPANAGPFGDRAARAAWAGMAAADRDRVSAVFANLGKAIAAYERLIMPGAAPFDAYVAALLAEDEAAMAAALSPEAVAGLRLFIGRGQCIQCHNGPLFSNHSFHNIGVPTAAGLALDYGRIDGVRQVQADEFNCLGPFSDAGPDDCTELRFMKTEGIELPGAFKTPSLRNVTTTGPYMHAGQFETLEAVLGHYNQAAPGPLGHQELAPLGLTGEEIRQLLIFLESLAAPPAVEPRWLRPPS